MRLALPFAVLTLFIASAAHAGSYTNDRFGTTIDYPSEVFDRPQPAPDNGDGQRWRSADGAELSVFASYNVLEEVPADFFKALVADRRQTTKLTYSRIDERWAVVSGLSDNVVYYEKYLFGAGDEIVHAVVLRYPAALKATYDPLVGPIAKSLGGP